MRKIHLIRKPALAAMALASAFSVAALAGTASAQGFCGNNTRAARACRISRLPFTTRAGVLKTTGELDYYRVYIRANERVHMSLLNTESRVCDQGDNFCGMVTSAILSGGNEADSLDWSHDSFPTASHAAKATTFTYTTTDSQYYYILVTGTAPTMSDGSTGTTSYSFTLTETKVG